MPIIATPTGSRRWSAAALLVALALLASACSSTAGGSRPSGPESTGPGSSTTSLKSTGTSGKIDRSPAPERLSKAAFVQQMDAVCHGVITKLAAVPAPTSADDNVALKNYSIVTLQEFPSYIDQAKALVARSPDQAELTSNWLTPEQSDFAVVRPLIARLVTAIDANDTAEVTSLKTQLNNSPDHSAAMAKFLTGYGLTDCASLETS